MGVEGKEDVPRPSRTQGVPPYELNISSTTPFEDSRCATLRGVIFPALVALWRFDI